MATRHAILSPSAAHRWLNCTAAPLLEAKEQDDSSDFALEGTLAHAYGARILKKAAGIAPGDEEDDIKELEPRYRTGEMDEYVEVYTTIVLEKLAEAKQRTPDARLLVEATLDFSADIDGSFGTADAVIIADGVMEVIDLKYGKGVKVSAIGNPQMRIYALGALDAYAFDYDITKVRMTIVQPRLDNLSTDELTVTELTEWSREVLRPKVAEAYAGGRQLAGEWCKFCKVRGKCSALAVYTENAMQGAEEAKTLTPDQVAALLPKLPTIKQWVADVEEYALQQALSGVSYQGFKLVAGRSVRKIADPASVAEALTAAGYDYIMRPPELRTITDLETMIGKKKFAQICGQWIVKPQGKPTLVPDSDKREALNPAADDFKGID